MTTTSEMPEPGLVAKSLLRELQRADGSLFDQVTSLAVESPVWHQVLVEAAPLPDEAAAALWPHVKPNEKAAGRLLTGGVHSWTRPINITLLQTVLADGESRPRMLHEVATGMPDENDDTVGLWDQLEKQLMVAAEATEEPLTFTVPMTVERLLKFGAECTTHRADRMADQFLTGGPWLDHQVRRLNRTVPPQRLAVERVHEVLCGGDMSAVAAAAAVMWLRPELQMRFPPGSVGMLGMLLAGRNMTADGWETLTAASGEKEGRWAFEAATNQIGAVWPWRTSEEQHRPDSERLTTVPALSDMTAEGVRQAVRQVSDVPYGEGLMQTAAVWGLFHMLQTHHEVVPQLGGMWHVRLDRCGPIPETVRGAVAQHVEPDAEGRRPPDAAAGSVSEPPEVELGRCKVGRLRVDSDFVAQADRAWAGSDVMRVLVRRARRRTMPDPSVMRRRHVLKAAGAAVRDAAAGDARRWLELVWQLDVADPRLYVSEVLQPTRHLPSTPASGGSGSSVTWVDAAVKALQTTGREMSAKEIWKWIDTHGVKTTSGVTPWKTIGRDLRRAAATGGCGVTLGAQPATFRAA